MNQPTRRDFSVGFVLFMATIVVIVSLFVVGDGGGLLTDQNEYSVMVPHSSGLSVGSKVFLSGVAVGKVVKIDFAENLNVDKVRIMLSVNRRHAIRIGASSTAWLKNEGLLGDAAVHISLGGDSRTLVPNSEIPHQPRALLEDFVGAETTATTTDFLDTLTAILKEIHSGRGSIGKLLRDPQLYENLNTFATALQGAVVDVKGVSSELKSMLTAIRSQKGTLGQLIYSESYARDISMAVSSTRDLASHLETISGKIAAGDGSLGKFVGDSTLYDELTQTLESFTKTAFRIETLLTSVQDSKSPVGRLLTDEALGLDVQRLLSGLERSSRSLEKILELVADGEGTLGELVHDPSIARSIRNAFIGVSDTPYLRNIVTQAEEAGKTLYAAQRDDEVAREIRKARALARMKAQTPKRSPQPEIEANGEAGVVPVSGETEKDEEP